MFIFLFFLILYFIFYLSQLEAPCGCNMVGYKYNKETNTKDLNLCSNWLEGIVQKYASPLPGRKVCGVFFFVWEEKKPKFLSCKDGEVEVSQATWGSLDPIQPEWRNNPQAGT